MTLIPPAEPIRVVRIIARLNIGGPALHVIHLQTGLDPARFRQVLITGSENPGEGSLVGLARARGVDLTEIPTMVADASLRGRDLRALAAIVRVLRRIRPHIVHTHTAKAGFLGRVAARLAGVPVVVHTFHGHILSHYYGPLQTRGLRLMERGLARLTDRIIAVSDQVRRDLLDFGVGRPEQIAVIPLGLDLGPFLVCEAHRGGFRAEIGARPGERLVGIVGRLFPVKNHRLFLEAAALLAREMPAVRFAVVGDGVLRGDLERLAASLGISDRMVFTGWRYDLPRVYADLDALAVSSNNEGTPVAAIEAMVAGVPVVATRVGGVPDLIADGETGLIVPPNDAEALAAALHRVLTNAALAESLAAGARAFVVSRFTVQRLIADTEALYLDLLRQKGIKTPESPASAPS
ncbi:MAG: glycosyltransferase [bacterium]|nr:glycosyltransferase [bacterium]